MIGVAGLPKIDGGVIDMDGTDGAAGVGCDSVGFAEAVDENGDVPPRKVAPGFANDMACCAGFAWVELVSCDGVKDGIGLGALVLPTSEGVEATGADGCVVCVAEA